MSVTTIRRSRDNMAKTMQMLKVRLRRIPETEIELRENLVRKIELLKIIRIEMKELMKQL